MVFYQCLRHIFFSVIFSLYHDFLTLVLKNPYIFIINKLLLLTLLLFSLFLTQYDARGN